MNILHTVKNIIIIVVALGLAFLLLGFIKNKEVQKENEVDSSIPEVTETESDFKLTSLKGVEIVINNPIENQLVTSPLTISGKAPGNWFFEASAPVTITNWDGLIIGESYIQAKGDWMTTDYVDFEGTLSFTNTEYGDYGFLILKKDNPSGEYQFDDSVEFRVNFK